jgi:hypothetical protein
MCSIYVSASFFYYRAITELFDLIGPGDAIPEFELLVNTGKPGKIEVNLNVHPRIP